MKEYLQDYSIDPLSAKSKEKNEDYEKVPLLKAVLGGVKNRGFAYDDYNYRPFVSKVKRN